MPELTSRAGVLLPVPTVDQLRVSKLSEICASWDGGLVVCPRRFWRDDLATMDFVYPVAHCWDTCHVFVDRFGAWPYAIHEMAHCFAMDQPVHLAGPTEPTGWQFLLACSLDVDAGRDWLSFYREYGLNVGQDFRDMSDDEIVSTMALLVNQDRCLGLVDGLSPVPLRRGPVLPPPPGIPDPVGWKLGEARTYVSP
jgi:hypothetical protein